MLQTVIYYLLIIYYHQITYYLSVSYQFVKKRALQHSFLFLI
nr:MAG TPA: hypothetical protein [Inoviridae sp.]